MIWVSSIPTDKRKKVTCKVYGSYNMTKVSKEEQVTITIPGGHGALKGRSLHRARFKRFKDRKGGTTN